uniref:Uncharacterized protein n=1 Tax=Leersia perrieri TaxID=77586 RepID=A0A0D9X7Z8_9ORYZ
MASPRCAVLLHPTGAVAGARRRLPLDHEQAFWGMEARRRRRRRLLSLNTPPHCSKMYVPGFGEGSPEKKAAINLQHFFNYIAVRVVLAQLQSYNREAYGELMEFVSRNSLNDADTFCKKLIRESPRHKQLGIDDVRNMVDEANIKLMRDYVLETSHIEDEK